MNDKPDLKLETCQEFLAGYRDRDDAFEATTGNSRATSTMIDAADAFPARKLSKDSDEIDKLKSNGRKNVRNLQPTLDIADQLKAGTRQPRDANHVDRVRIRVALLGLAMAAVNCYAQATFCIAIVEMVLPADFVLRSETDESIVKVIGASSPVDPVALEDQSCPVEYKYRDYYDSWRFQANSTDQRPVSVVGNNVIDMSNRFDWDASRQGLLLGAFAVGTAPLQVLGGRLAEIYGAKWVLLAGCVGTALTNLTIPFLAHFSFVLLILNRVLMGVAQAGMEPGLMCLLAAWLTPNEVGFFISMLLFAICVGFFLGSLCSSFILSFGYGWPLAYYVAGGLNLAVSILWLLFASSRPSESRLISEHELRFIEHEQQLAKAAERAVFDLKGFDWADLSAESKSKLSSSSTDDLDGSTTQSTVPINTNNPRATSATASTSADATRAPWLNILTTKSVWAFIICKISIRWCADVVGIELPTYLANVLHLSIKLNGILNSISSALFAIFSFLTGYLVSELVERQNEPARGGSGMSKTTLRKLIQSIASFGSALAVFLMTQYDCNILFSMSMLLVLSCCLVMGTGGELQIPYDMTSRYPGTLHGMACTLSVSGWLAPPLIGLILGDQPSSRHRWSLVWYMTAFINLVGGLVFVLFADASPRDFDAGCTSANADARHRASEEANCVNDVGHHNEACKSADSSPSIRAKRSTSPADTIDSGQLAAAKSDLNWSPHFDREPIRCRQVGDSLMAPGYLHNFDLVSTNQTMQIFPYIMQQQRRRTKNNGNNGTCDTSAPGSLSAPRRASGQDNGRSRWTRPIWRRLAGGRKEFDFAAAAAADRDDHQKAAEGLASGRRGPAADRKDRRPAASESAANKTITHL